MVGIRAWGRAAALLLVAAGCVVSQPAAAEPSADSQVAITWPEITDLNPDTTPYVIGIDNPDGHDLYLTGGDWEHGDVFEEAIPLPRHGQFRVDFPPVASPYYLLAVTECPPSTGIGDHCRLAAVSPRLTVYNMFRTVIPRSAWPYGPARAIEYTTFEPRPDGPVDVAWELTSVGPDQTPILSGQAQGVEVDHGFVLDDPAGSIPEATRMLLKATATGVAEFYGALEGTVWEYIEWDPANRAKVLMSSYFRGEYRNGIDTFYPFPDDIGDVLAINVADESIRWMEATVVNSAGEEVYSSGRVTNRVFWRGKATDGEMLPEGEYTVRVKSADLALNEGVATAVVTLSHDRPVERTWRPTFAADDVMIDGHAGACGRVKQPARRAWEGSVGLYTSDTCRPRRQRVSRATHHVDLPLSSGDIVISAALTVNGDKARREKASSVWIRLRDGSTSNPESWWRPWIEIPGGAGPVEIRVPIGVVSDEHPALVWEAKVNGGDRFDLRDFTVELRYRTFGSQDPD